MKNYKSLISLIAIFLMLISEILFINYANAAFDVNGVGLFKDGNLCIVNSSQTQTVLPLSSILTNLDSVQARISSSGSFCKPTFFTGGAIQSNTSGKVVNAQPNVQAYGRGILISEPAPISSSSSGDFTAFGSLVNRFGGTNMLVFEITLPQGCDVVDDDDDADGTASVLSGINDFSFPACSSTNGLNVNCNDVSSSGLITPSNILVPASSGSPAKVRFAISSINFSSDVALIDSALIKFDSQDIFCPTTSTAPLIATITAKNAIDSPTLTETIGSADLGSPIKALDVSYVLETVSSTKGESSTNSISSTAVLKDATSTTSNSIQVVELDNESIPVGGQSSQTLIEPVFGQTSEITMVNIWLVPSLTNIFSAAPSTSDITFSDNSLALSSSPYIVKSSNDDPVAPIGTLVLPIKKNDAQGSLSPAANKTTITIKNITLGAASSDGTISALIYEPTGQAVVNTPGVASINNTSSPTNPQNYSAFAYLSTRAQLQTSVISTIVNETSMLTQPLTDADLALVTSRNTTLGSPQIVGFTKVITSIPAVDISKVSVSNSNSVLTISGASGASVSGAKVKIDILPKSSSTIFDSVTVTSGTDGIFTAKLKADFSSGDATLNFKQTVSGMDSTVSSKIVSASSSSSSSSSGSLSCDKTVCGCSNTSCTPTINQVLSYIQTNGGLSSVITAGGNVFNEVINSLKKALGLT